jgi:hypothetical protein
MPLCCRKSNDFQLASPAQCRPHGGLILSMNYGKLAGQPIVFIAGSSRQAGELIAFPAIISLETIEPGLLT